MKIKGVEIEIIDKRGSCEPLGTLAAYGRTSGIMPNEVNVLIGDGVEDTDMDLFFGPLRNGDVFVICDPLITKAQLAKLLGIFPSTSQAAKNGWGGSVPDGWSEFSNIGKLHRNVWVLKDVSA